MIMKAPHIQIVLCTSILLLVVSCSAQNKQAPVPDTEYFSPYKSTLLFDGTYYSGNAYEYIRDKARSAQYVVVGESHGTAEIANFTSHMFRQLAPYGFTHYMLETSPSIAHVLSEIVSKDDPDRMLTQFLTLYPHSIPFYTLKEEFNILKTVSENSSAPQPIWGTDYEYMFSAPYLFDMLNEQIPEKADADLQQIKTVLANRSRQELKKISRYAQTESDLLMFYQLWRSSGNLFLMSSDPTEVHRGLNVIVNSSNTDKHTKDLAERILQSNKIYSLGMNGDPYTSNMLRAEMQIRDFENYLQNYVQKNDTLPKVLAKYGSVHAGKSENIFGDPDIGAALYSSAEKAGRRSFHLMILPLSGKSNVYVPLRTSDYKNYPIELSGSYRAFLQHIDLNKPDEWVYIDLEQFRLDQPDMQLNSRLITNIVQNFDGILLIPEVAASGSIE